MASRAVTPPSSPRHWSGSRARTSRHYASRPAPTRSLPSSRRPTTSWLRPAPTVTCPLRLLLRRRELRRTPQRVEKLLDSTLEPTSRTQRPFSVVFWPWFSGVVFVFDLPTGQIATFFNRLPLTAKFGEFLFHALG